MGRKTKKGNFLRFPLRNSESLPTTIDKNRGFSDSFEEGFMVFETLTHLEYKE